MTPFLNRLFSIPGLLAGADLSANQYRFVKPGATEMQVVAIAAATDKPIAVQLDKPNAAGKPVETVSLGVVPVEAGAAVSVGAEVQTDASGRAITLTTGGIGVGRALSAASGAGERIAVALNAFTGRVV